MQNQNGPSNDQIAQLNRRFRSKADMFKYLDRVILSAFPNSTIHLIYTVSSVASLPASWKSHSFRLHAAADAQPKKVLPEVGAEES